MGKLTLGNKDGFNANIIHDGEAQVCQMYGIPMHMSVEQLKQLMKDEPGRYDNDFKLAKLFVIAPKLEEENRKLRNAIQDELDRIIKLVSIGYVSGDYGEVISALELILDKEEAKDKEI